MFFTTLVAMSSLPDWWWTKGPGLPDPPVERSLQNRLIVAGLTVAGGLGAAALFGRDTVTASVAAFAGGRLGGKLATVALNPQPLPPKERTTV